MPFGGGQKREKLEYWNLGNYFSIQENALVYSYLTDTKLQVHAVYTIEPVHIFLPSSLRTVRM